MHGSTVYAGGAFTNVGGGLSRNRLAAIDASSGSPTDWNPDVAGAVRTIVVGDLGVYVGGNYPYVGNQPRQGLAVFEP